MRLGSSEHTGIQMMVASWEICVNSLTLTPAEGGQQVHEPCYARAASEKMANHLSSPLEW